MKIIVPSYDITGVPCGIHRVCRQVIGALVDAGHTLDMFGSAYPDPIPGTNFVGYHGIEKGHICLLPNNGTVPLNPIDKGIINRLFCLGVPIVSILYDIIPYWVQKDGATHQRYVSEVLYTLNTSKKVLTISEFSKSDMVNLAPWCADRTVAVPLGMSLNRLEIAKNKDAIRLPYIVCPLGGFDYRKKVINMVKAVTKLNGKIRLLLVGRPFGIPQELQSLLHNNEHIEITGFVSDEELIRLYSTSQALIFLSDIEGFGLPIIEAFACGTPVITNRGSSLAEIGGDAATYVDKDDVDDICRGINLLIDNSAVWKRHSKLGLDRVKKYDIDKYKDTMVHEIITTSPADSGTAFPKLG